MDPIVLERLLASILAQRLVVVCGAQLSMGKPTAAPSARAVSQICFDNYAASTGAALDAVLRDDLERLADYFYDNHMLQSVFIASLVPWDRFVRPPNAGHVVLADFLWIRAVAAALSSNYDTMIERHAGNCGADLRPSRGGETFSRNPQTRRPFRHVISTKIDKSTSDRPHFFLAYGTKSSEGLKAFRETEYSALRAYAKTRANAKEKKLEDKSNIPDLFSGHEAGVQEATIDDIVGEQKTLASTDLLKVLSKNPSLKFSDAVIRLLQPFMLRETNVKDICVELAKAGRIDKTWGGGNRKPQDTDVIKLRNA